LVDSEDRSKKLAAGIDQSALGPREVEAVAAKDTMNDKQTEAGGYQPRKRYDETYKRNAVELTLKSDRSVKEVAEQLGLCPSMLTTWRRKYAPVPASASGVKGALSSEEKDQEIARLRADNMRLREREIVLKKSLGILSETPESGMPRLKR
jgi:transposase